MTVKSWSGLSRRSRVILLLVGGCILLFLCYVGVGLGIYYWKEHVPYDEAGAMASLQALYTMEENFKEEKGAYAGSLEELGTPLGARVEGNQLTWGDGYLYEFSPVRSDSSGRVTEYWIVARPAVYKWRSKRSYLMDQNGTIHFTVENRQATTKDPTLKMNR